MQHLDMTKEQLLEEIAYLKRLNKELLEQIYEDDITKSPWSGNLGQWFWDYPRNIVTFNPMKVTALGYAPEDIPEEAGFEFFTEKLHPEDYDMVMDEMRAHLSGRVPVWEVKYRIQAKDGSWKVFYDRGKVTQRSADNKPLFLSGNVFDVTEDEIMKYELIQKTAFWRTKARMDGLTNLYTRAALEEELLSLHQRHHTQQQPYAIMLLDLDHFKRINDTYGHLVGDRVLATLGQTIRSNIRDSDIAARYGGEEFLVVFPSCGSQTAAQIGEIIKQGLLKAELPFTQPVCFSAGVASSTERQTLNELIDLADQRLYKAKNTGRNRIIL